jgi:hypothetical protein
MDRRNKLLVFTFRELLLFIVQYVKLLYSQKGDTIYDPFMSSGTTAVACVKNDRNYGLALMKIVTQTYY